MEKYMINNLEEFASSLADSIKKMPIQEMMKEKWTLAEDIESIVRGCAYCSEMKKNKKKE